MITSKIGSDIIRQINFRVYILNIISKLLLTYRDISHLTQKELSAELFFFSDAFEAVNAVTLSRWETGVTVPAKQRKVLLLKFILSKGCAKEEKCLDLFIELYKNIQKPLEDTLSLQLKHMIGNFPESREGEYTLHQLRDTKDTTNHLDILIQIEKSMSTAGTYKVSESQIDKWCSYLASFACLCEQNGQYAGHHILLKLKTAVADEIIHHKREVTTLDENDFCSQKEKGTYLFFAFYGRSPKVTALLSVEHYLFLLENTPYIDNIAIYSTREDIETLLQGYGVAHVATGKDEKHNVTWHGFSAPVEEVLFSSSVLQAIE